MLIVLGKNEASAKGRAGELVIFSRTLAILLDRKLRARGLRPTQHPIQHLIDMLGHRISKKLYVTKHCHGLR